MRATFLLLGLAVPLAACAKGSDGTTITLNASDGNTVASADGRSGKVTLDVPGFQGKFTLPKLQVTADDFDLNGVHLYPGSTIRSLNIDAGKHDGAGADGGVRVAFTSPASPAAVRNWLTGRLNKAGFRVSVSGNGLVGETDEHKPFALRMTPTSDGKGADGTIAIGG